MNFLKDSTMLPLGNGGGTCKTITQVRKFLGTAIGIIEIGSITQELRPGNTGNTFHKGKNSTLNSLGLPNLGRKYYEENLKEMVGLIHYGARKVIVNIVGFSLEECASLTRLAFDCGADFVVVNAGCPNVWVDNVQKGILTYDLDGLKKVIIHTLSQNVKEAREGRIGVKFSPVLDPLHMQNIATFLNSLVVPLQDNIGFIGFVTTQNTVPNCFDEEGGNPVISPAGGLAGMAGEAVFPMALAQVKQWRRLLDPKIKIIGVGGITHGVDMYKMLQNGADLVQVVSAYYACEDFGVFNQVGSEYLELNEK